MIHPIKMKVPTETLVDFGTFKCGFSEGYACEYIEPIKLQELAKKYIEFFEWRIKLSGLELHPDEILVRWIKYFFGV